MSQKHIFIRLSKVKEITGLSRSTIYAMLNPKSKYFDPSFPKQIKLSNASRSAVAWLLAEIEAWQMSRLEARALY